MQVLEGLCERLRECASECVMGLRVCEWVWKAVRVEELRRLVKEERRNRGGGEEGKVQQGKVMEVGWQEAQN